MSFSSCSRVRPLRTTFDLLPLSSPPLEYKATNGQAEGVAVDIVRKIMGNLGHKVDVSVYPWARALEMVKVGEADAIFTAYKTPERETFSYYSNNVSIPQVISFYVVPDSPVTFDGDLAKLKGRKIGVVSTISYGKIFDDMCDQLNIDRTDNLELNFKKLEIGRLDMLVSNIYVGDWTIKQMGMSGRFKRLPQQVQSVDSYIGFSKAKGQGHEALRDAFDKELDNLIAEGIYAAIMLKYGIEQ